MYRESSLGQELGQWNPAWIHLVGEGSKWSIAMRCDPIASAPLVRTIIPELAVSTNVDMPGRQALSLCTPVTLWLMAVENGWFRSNPETGWFDYRWEEIPQELRDTGLV